MSTLLSRTLEDVRDQPKKRNSASNGDGRQPEAGNRHSPYSRPKGDDSWSHDMYNQHNNPTVARNDYNRSRAGANPRNGERSAKLMITNVNYEISESELQTLFAQIGPIVAGPKIKFDRSGRSTGMAWVTYSNEDLAEEALKAFQGAPCKGDRIHIRYDYWIDDERTRGVPAEGTLLARLDNRKIDRRDKAMAADRLGDEKPRSSSSWEPPLRPRASRGVGGTSSDRPPRDAPTGPRADASRPSADSGARVGRGGARGGRGAGGGDRGGRREEPTQDDLDRELEAFMQEPKKEPKSVAATNDAAPATEQVAEAPEVEMA